ncbi:MAG: phosphoenolpyruvate synthase [Sulfolobales archaeon]
MKQDGPRFKYIFYFEEAPEDINLIGGKGLGLVRLVKNSIPTAPGFIITTRAFIDFLRISGLEKTIRGAIEAMGERGSPEEMSRELMSLIEGTELPDEIAREIAISYEDLCRKAVGSNICRVAVRSSAIAEDLAEASFAGQHDTFLNVYSAENVLQAVKKCWASLFTARALVYRKAKGLVDEKSLAMAVVVQIMVDPRSAGVAFSINPLDGDPNIVVIESIWGLGEYIVRGVVTPDKFVVEKSSLDVVERFISKKDRELVYDPEKRANLDRQVPGERAEKPSISDEEAREIASIAMKLEKMLGTPVDIEWAIDGNGRLYILQVRPVTTVPKPQPPRKIQERGKRIFKGLAASPGIGVGRAKILRSVEEAKLKGFNRGEVLVTSMTDPDWVPLMRIASAIVTEKGGVTSHAAITARELGIPAVVGVAGIMDSIVDGEILKVDGSRGIVEVIEHLEQEKKLDNGYVEVSLATQAIERVEARREEIYIPTATKIYMNLGEPEAIEKYLDLPFDGIGLMRIEFVISSWIGYHPLYLIKHEKQEFFIDRLSSGIAMVASKIAPRPVVVRFSDFKSNEYKRLIGGESFEPDERNPMLGWRGASRYIHPLYREAFKLELKAIKRVREEMGLKNVWVMVPMVRTLWEAEKVIELMAEEDLRSSKDFKIWAMAEVPSVALLIDKFSKYFDGFSIGSNDLTQMVLGIDRDSDLLSSMGYFDERDEAVLRAMRMIIRGAKRNGRTVSICGQAPSYYPEIVEFLVREGIDSISVNPDAVISTRRIVASVERKLMLEMLEELKNRRSGRRSSSL